MSRASFPLGGPARAKTAVRVSGWNLPTGSVTMDATDAGAGHGVAHRAARRDRVEPRAVRRWTRCRDIVEREPNNAPTDASTLALPVVVNGRIHAAGDVDVFAVKGRAGEQIVAEVTARRLGSPLDSVVEIVDAAGARIARNDDEVDKAPGS